MFKNLTEVFIVFLRLGLTSFGGPIAHISYFHEEFVKRRKWFTEQAYADLVSLCQFLPGPASSQVGIAIGLSRAGYLGALAAWIGFTLPSAAILIVFGLGISKFSVPAAYLHALKIVAVAVVAQAIWAMASKLCPDKKRITVAVIAACITLLFPMALTQILVIIGGGLLGLFILRLKDESPHTPFKTPISKSAGFSFLCIFLCTLLLLPLLIQTTERDSIRLFDSFFRAGSLVFGGGHVVLPLLEAEVVQTGWVSKDSFMTGYGAAQAIPGPLFAISAYLGAVSNLNPSGWMGALLCLMAAFLPAFLLIVGILPFWEQIRKYKQIRFAMFGINAAVVGLLIAAFYNPVWTSAIFNTKDFALALICFLFLVSWEIPAWLVVGISLLVGGLVL